MQPNFKTEFGLLLRLQEKVCMNAIILLRKNPTNPWINLGPGGALAPGYTEVAARVTDALLSLLLPAVFHTRAMHKYNLYIQGRKYRNCTLLPTLRLYKVRFQKAFKSLKFKIAGCWVLESKIPVWTSLPHLSLGSSC